MNIKPIQKQLTKNKKHKNEKPNFKNKHCSIMLQINYLYTYRLKLSRNIAIKSSNKYSIEHTHLEHFKINKQSLIIMVKQNRISM